ncbi:MAG TPA: pyruvate, phosphate dikinase [Planctomycetota bacterium]|nr:pyruvate, phosphate dikinase [Planctomycetota bacterium]
MDKRRIYSFGNGEAEGSAGMVALLGGKGAGLQEMTRLGIPVPPGFTITTETCDEWSKAERKLPEGLFPELDAALARLEKASGKTFGTGENPLLVSVRSGAAVSMPGMMETVLDLGMNPDVAQTLERRTGDRRFVWDTYRRFVQMFSNVVANVPHEPFEKALHDAKARASAKQDTDLDADALARLTHEFKDLYRRHRGRAFPDDPREQLLAAIEAVFASFWGKKAMDYRRIEKISDSSGTAVTVQAMVFGNTGPRSGTGVAFTRDPSTGEDRLYGEWLANAQGEDVVAGIRTPRPVAEMEKELPEVHQALLQVKETLEEHYRDVQDLEFTWEDGKLYLLQTRRAKRTAAAAVRTAAEFLRQRKIDPREAVSRVEPRQLMQLLARVFDVKEVARAHKEGRVVARGLPASPGAASGPVVFNPEDAEAQAKAGKPAILVRRMTSPEDIAGMAAAAGLLTSVGGMTSHAAVVARGMGKCCIVGCAALRIDEERNLFTVGGREVRRGDRISIDGFTGDVILGELATQDSEVVEVVQGRRNAASSRVFNDIDMVLRAADTVRRLKVRANADTPQDAQVARVLGAEGIGLVRTEHMFFAEDRILPMREMILADTVPARKKALEKLLPYQRDDFIGIFRAMAGLPVTIRLLDPPLHEFLPETDAIQRAVAARIGMDLKELQERVSAHQELNPMLGHRGCRLGVSHPEIYEMQARAVIEAACLVSAEDVVVRPEIMVPFIGVARELEILRKLIVDEAERVLAERGEKIAYTVGTMIEIPRAAITADQISRHADFFSFGTNDLTQMTFGISRDDAEKAFLPDYEAKGILPENPFAVLDRDGVGGLVKIAVERGRMEKPKLKCGICGEHGGDPSSIAFCHKVGLDYVSCSPYRVPVARLAAARAALT